MTKVRLNWEEYLIIESKERKKARDGDKGKKYGMSDNGAGKYFYTFLTTLYDNYWRAQSTVCC
jgi:hypothetical protein